MINYPRQSPVHRALADGENITAGTLQLSDLSSLPKFGIKGPQAETWLKGHGVEVPDEVYAYDRRENPNDL